MFINNLISAPFGVNAAVWPAYVFTFVFGVIAVKLSRVLAINTGFVDHPDTAVKTHQKSTPYLGGLGIFTTFIISSVFFLNHSLDVSLIIELSCLAFVFFLGLLDDRYALSVHSRLISHCLVASILIFNGNIMSVFGYQWANILFTFGGIILMINAFNILDILDGLAAGISIIIISTLCLILSEISPSNAYFYLGLFFAVSLMAFLVFNFNPAKIFMGDAGSTLIGLFISIMCIKVFNQSPGGSFKAGSLFAVSIPVFEVFYVSCLRIRKGLNPMMGSKDHFPLRIRKMGFSIKQTVLLCYFITLCSSIFSLIAIGKSFIFVFLSGVFLLVGYLGLGIFLAKVKVE
jgi:UDP-GlcNAc:undecaprenyl-phosphate GlcNAc-1-phosphate transferase